MKELPVERRAGDRTRRGVLGLGALAAVSACTAEPVQGGARDTAPGDGRQEPSTTPSGSPALSSAETSAPTPTPEHPLLLLGTSPGPVLDPRRAGIASLVTTSGGHYLIDSGVGVATQLARAGLMPADVRTVLLTHLHDDHTAGLIDWLSFRYTTAISQPVAPLRVLGPPGTAALVSATCALLEVSAAIRRDEDGVSGPAVSDLVIAEEIGPGRILQEEGITVDGVENTHYSDRGAVEPGASLSLSYRVQLIDRVLAFTGDTGPSAAVDELAAGADVLIAEMVSDQVDLAGLPGYTLEKAQAGHLSPAQVGQMAAAGGVGRVVLSHYTQATDSDLATIAAGYPGQVTPGTDLLQI